MTVRAVIWDMGGVLLRSEDYTSRDALAARLGMTRLELEHLVFSADSGPRAQRGEISVAQHWENLRQELKLSPAEIDAFVQEFFDGDRLDADLLNYIRALRQRYKTGLLSNAFSNLRHLVTHDWQCADAFDEMVISAEVGVMKPDARVYRLALERLGVAAQEAVFVDDFQRNVEGARAVNMQAVHFCTPQQARTELEQILKGSQDV